MPLNHILFILIDFVNGVRGYILKYQPKYTTINHCQLVERTIWVVTHSIVVILK